MQEFGFSTIEAFPEPKAKLTKRTIIGYSSPKMFYTPDEIEQDIPVIKLAFTNNNVIKLFLREFYKPTDIQIIQYLLTYKKVILTNCEYEFVYVQEGQEELFLEMYMGIKHEEKQKFKKYI